MRFANLIKHSVAALTGGFVVLSGVEVAWAAPLPSSTVVVKAAAASEITAVVTVTEH
jgi:hypothetical protein